MPRPVRPCVAVAACLLVVPTHSSAQSQPALGEDGEVGATLSIRTGLTWLSGGVLPVVAAAGTLRFSPSLEVGGEGVFGLGAIGLSAPDSPAQSNLETGYGGLLIRWSPGADAPGMRWGGGLLVGAGAARIRSPLANATIVSENYYFIEPRFGLMLRRDRPLRFGAEGAYRVTLGTDALPGIEISELRGAVVSLVVQFVSDP